MGEHSISELVAEFEHSFTFRNDDVDVVYVESRGPKEVYRELSEFVFYFSQEVTTPDGRVGDLYTLVSDTLKSNNFNPDKPHYWRSDVLFFAETIFNLCKDGKKKFEWISKLELTVLLDRNKEFKKQLEMKEVPAHLAEIIVRRADFEETLRILIKKMPKPYQKLGLWCMAARHVKEKYDMIPPDAPDFGKIIYNKAVRLNLEQYEVIPRSPPLPKRSLPFNDDGTWNRDLILSNWEKDTCKKDCTSKEIAASFLDESYLFLKILPQDDFNATIRANKKRLQDIYCNEFPEFYDILNKGNNICDELPERLQSVFRKMPLPDQTNFVERLKAKVTTRHMLGGNLDDAFMRELNDQIRRGITEPMYDGWAQVFQLREKTKHMSLLKMVIQMSYLMMFIESYQGNEVFNERKRISSQATKRLQDLCDTNILSPYDSSFLELAPYFL